MFATHLSAKGHMSWDDSLLAVGSDSLSLYSLQGVNFTQLQSVPTKVGISSLEWSKTSEVVLATGSNTGTLSFYRKSGLLSDPGKSLVKEDKIIENVQLGSLQFCPSKPNLLAIGANELYMYNLDAGLTGRDPTRYVFKLGKNSMEGKRLTSIAWNPQVQYILAAATQNCAASVWDLRCNQTLFNVHDPNYLNKSLCSGIAWNPDIPTQFIMAYDDVTTPNLQIWDLRKHEQPVKELKINHQSGITALSWCPYDSSIFASSDRSGYTNFWSFRQCQVFMRAQHAPNSVPNSIKWVPKHSGLISFGFETGDIEIQNIYSPVISEGTRKLTSDQPIDVQKPSLVHTPNWVLKKGCCSFNYSSKLSTSLQTSSKIAVNSTKPPEFPLKPKIDQAHKLFTEGKLSELCSFFSESSSEMSKLQWQIIGSKSTGNISEILSLLGFNRRSIETATEKQTGKKRGTHEEVPSGRKESFHDNFSFVDLSAVDAVDFFNKAGAKHEEVKQQVETLKSEPEFVQTILETISKNVNWEEGCEKLIRENIILGNLEAAIDCALICGRTAEALIIAAQGGEELFNITRDSVLSSSKDLFLKNSFLPLLSKNVSELIEKMNLDKWKEALTLIIINNSNAGLVVQFAEKLEQAGMHEAAEVCYLYSGTSERVIESWVRKFRQAVSEGSDYETEVFLLFYKALLYSEAFKYGGSELLERVYLEYLNLLTKKGMTNEAFEIMKQLKSPKHSMSLMVFVERHTKTVTGASKVPWKIMNVMPVKVKSKETEVKRPEKPVFSKEASHPEPIKAPFVEPIKSKKQDFAEPPKQVFQVPVRSPFPPAPKAGNTDNQIKPVSERMHPPPPHSNEFKKNPFNEIKAPGPKPEERHIDPPPAAQKPPSSNVPPPPPPSHQNIPPPTVKKDTQEPFPALTKTEPKPAKPIEHDPPRTQEAFNPPEPKPKVEERKVAPPAVPRTVPPPRPPVALPGKTPTKPANEGVDLSGIPANLQPLAVKWETAIHDGSIASNPRILKDVETKMQEFFNKLKNQELSENTLTLVTELTQAFEAGDFVTVNKTHLELTNKTWTENGNWLTGMKRIIQARQSSKGK